jgi:GT2 family glycosyltransferase
MHTPSRPTVVRTWKNTVPLLASVVLPTHRRCESLQRVLKGLGRQSVPADTFEVIVVCDGDVDGSALACRELASTLPYHLRIIEQTNQGPATARNRGVAEARAPLIIFIDDDVVPDEHLIAVHLAAQAGQDMRVTIGPLLPPPDFRLNPWGTWEEQKLCRQYDDMIAGRWQATYRQFYTGNASLLKHHIIEAGGFDPAYRRAEDVELALRLRKRGLHFVFLPEARGWHYVQRTYDSWLRISMAYGFADVAMARSGWPEVLEFVPDKYRNSNLVVRTITQLCVGRSAITRIISTLLGVLLKGAIVTRSSLLGNIACSLIFNLRYYEGLATALGGRMAFMKLLRGGSVTALLERTA